MALDKLEIIYGKSFSISITYPSELETWVGGT